MSYQYEFVDTNMGRFLLMSRADRLVYVGGPQSQLEDAREMLHLTDDAQFEANALAPGLVASFRTLLTGETTPMDPCLYAVHGTDFQQTVYEQLRAVPFGETRTYSQLAEAIGRPNSVRAVAHAVAQNPLLIVQPCHRIVPKAAGIGQYSGGRDLKRKLLDFEAGKCVDLPM